MGNRPNGAPPAKAKGKGKGEGEGGGERGERDGDGEEEESAPPPIQHSISDELVAENNMARVDHKHFSPGFNVQPPPANLAYLQQAQMQQQQQQNKNKNINSEMLLVGGKCAQIGCRCSSYSESASKWSKGKCKTCNHSENQHKKPTQAQFSFDTNTKAKAPQQPQPQYNNNKKIYNNKASHMMYNSPKGLPPTKPQPLPQPQPQPQSSPNQQLLRNNNINQQSKLIHNTNNGGQQSQSIFNPNVNSIESQSPPPTEKPALQNNKSHSHSSPFNNFTNPNQQNNHSRPPQTTFSANHNQYTHSPQPGSRKQRQALNKGSLPTPPMQKSRSANINNKKKKNALKKAPARSVEMAANMAGIATLQATTAIVAQNKESIYMDMTIAQYEKMQSKQGNAANKIATQNLDKNKTVRQILEEQKQLKQTQNQSNHIILKALDSLQNNNNNNNNNNNHQNNNNQNNNNQNNTYYNNNNNNNNNYNQNTRMRATSDDSAPKTKTNYNQALPFNNNNNNNNININNNNNNSNRGPFQAMAGFQPAAATGLQAKNIEQKMAPQGLQHKAIQQPHQNPWNKPQPQQPAQPQQPQHAQAQTPKHSHNSYNYMKNNNNNNNNNNKAYRPPPPNNAFRPQYQGQKYDHNFKNKSYNKKQVRQRNAQRQQKKQTQNEDKKKWMAQKLNEMDGTQYDSDESVFVTQAAIARESRRHSWGSSSLEPSAKPQPFGKPVYVNQGKKEGTKSANTNSNTNVSFNDMNEAAQYSTKQLVSELELSEQSFYKKYWIEDGTVGTGSFAKVRKVTRKKDKKEFALKMIKKAGKSAEDLEALQREIGILARLSHPNVVPLVAWCETKKRIYMVVEFCSGGDVFERILKQKTFSEKEAAHVVRAVAEGLHHVHLNHIIHRDLKPDNLMYLTKDPDSNILLIDFGLAGDASLGPLSTPCGTAHYVAPEVLSSVAYNSKADMWSLGVIIYMLLCGFPPFFDAQGNQKRLYKLIKLGKYRFPSPYWDYVSEPAKDLITNLLQLDPAKRYSAKQVLMHKWINKSADIEEIDLGKMYMEQMEHFSSSRHFIDDGLKLHQPPAGAAKIGGIQNNQYHQQQTSANTTTTANIQYFKHQQHAPKYDDDDDDDDW